MITLEMVNSDTDFDPNDTAVDLQTNTEVEISDTAVVVAADTAVFLETESQMKPCKSDDSDVIIIIIIIISH